MFPTPTFFFFNFLLWNFDGAPQVDGVLKNTVRSKIIHYLRLYEDRPDPVFFMSLVVNISVRLYDDFIRLIFLRAHRGATDLTRELPEVLDQFRILHASFLANLKVSVPSLVLLPPHLPKRYMLGVYLCAKFFKLRLFIMNNR